MDPIAAMQHRNREAVHDIAVEIGLLMGGYQLAKRSIERDEHPAEALEKLMGRVERAAARLHAITERMQTP